MTCTQCSSAAAAAAAVSRCDPSVEAALHTASCQLLFQFSTLMTLKAADSSRNSNNNNKLLLEEDKKLAKVEVYRYARPEAFDVDIEWSLR